MRRGGKMLEETSTAYSLLDTIDMQIAQLGVRSYSSRIRPDLFDFNL